VAQGSPVPVQTQALAEHAAQEAVAHPS
jgi:hypothetical protein